MVGGNSKEAYAGGIAGAVTALTNWHGSKTGKRDGPKVKFPRLARLPASQAEAPSDGRTGPARHVAVKRVNHLRKVA